MRTISIVYGWICDYEHMTAYRRQKGRYVRRDADGILEVISSLPNHIQEFINELLSDKPA